MKNKKVIRIILFIISLILIAIFFNREYSIYILIDGITCLKYQDGNYTVVSKDSFINYKMNIYDSLGYKEQHTIKEREDGFLEYTDYIIGNKYIAFREENLVKVAHFSKKKLDVNNIEILNTILAKHDIYNYTELIRNEQIYYDLDNDNVNELIISVSNYSLDSEDKKYFNFVYVIDDNEIKYLVEEVYDSSTSFIGNYEIEYLMSIDDNTYDIILYFSDWDSNYHEIYHKEKDLFEKKL